MPHETPGADDLAYARAAGYWFDEERITHDGALRRIIRAADLVSLGDVALGFVASLSRRILHLRPALGSWFAARSAEPHAYEGTRFCERCSLVRSTLDDFNSTNFARYKWGRGPLVFGADHAFVLERFAIEPRPAPTAEDRAVLATLLHTADSMPRTTRARDLETAWRPLVPSTRREREALIEILGMSGVLTPSGATPLHGRRMPSRTDWSAPIALWRGEDGIDVGRADMIFASTGWRPRGS